MFTSSVVVSIFALIVSGFALSNSMRQRKIASESLRFSLYNKRFSIYLNTMNFALDYLTSDRNWSDVRFLKKEIEFAATIHESTFLFDPKDEIPAILREIKGLINQIHKREQGVDSAHVILKLEKIKLKMEPYLNFHHISVDDSLEWWRKLKSKFGKIHRVADQDQLPFP